MEVELREAVHRGDVAAVERLLAAGHDVDDLESVGGGWSPLFVAADNADVKIIRLLCERGADINHRSSVDGATALMIALSSECMNATDRADPVAHPSFEAVRALLELGADPRIADDAGRTAVDKARLHGFPELVELLRSHRLPE